MFSNKENINILSALIVKHAVQHVVVCPGSRNAPIVHNFKELEKQQLIKCYPVTDERSAGFYAIGISQAVSAPVAVCVTSGSALLNLAPAVAEAKYQHIPLIVISADRPSAWIDQLDGQTLPQPYAFGDLVRKCVNLPEPHTDEERWYCNRLINEALIESTRDSGTPVHINIPISEPLFTFDTATLPDERKITLHCTVAPTCSDELLTALRNTSKPMLVIGQTKNEKQLQETINALKTIMPVVQEPLSGTAIPMDNALKIIGNDSRYMPHLIIYIGDTVVSKPMRKFLRMAHDANTWRISEEGCIEDCFTTLTNIVQGKPQHILQSIVNEIKNTSGTMPIRIAEDYRELWDKAISDAQQKISSFSPSYSARYAIKEFEKQLTQSHGAYAVHYANSTAIRLACIYANHYVYCNRGVNGIEGCLSTAAGFSSATTEKTFCITGDLSFFYDQNALWNTNLHGNLRILLLNDGGGKIFSKLHGLDHSEAFAEYISAQHTTSAKGICSQNNITYLTASNKEETDIAIHRLINDKSERPILAEIILEYT